jgi:hypothetical protein
MNDYKDEFLPRLQKSFIYNTLKEKCAEKDSEVTTLVENLVYYSIQRTKTIIKHMGEFTLHDSEHLFRVLHLMERIITKPVIKKLSSPELMLLILSAFFHDIGMAPDEKDVIAWKKVWDNNPEFENEQERIKYQEFKRFYFARPDRQEIINELIKQEKHSTADIIKAYEITEYIRQTHAERAREIIAKDWNGKIVFRDTDLTVDFAQICYNHNEDAISLLELNKNLLCASETFACLPLVGVVLRLADILDFDAKRTPDILYSHLYVRNPISVNEWNKHRSVQAWEINPEIIQFNATCKHPAIEASIHEFCDLIDRELSVCNNIISTLNEFNKGRDIAIRFPYKVNRDKIKTQRDIKGKPQYIYRDTKFSLSKKQVIDILMGTKLYGKPEVALRELLQNSIDACQLRQAQEKQWGNPYIPEIFVRYYLENGETILEVNDNGTGMNQHIIDNYYSKVGSSFYKSTDFYNLKSESNADFTPRSRFGIGILSCFMVADTLIVDTRRVCGAHKSDEPLNITVEGQESIFWIKEGNRQVPGTTTKLILRKERNPWEQLTEDAFIKSVESIIPNPPFKIHIQTTNHEKFRDENSFKEITVSTLKDYSWQTHENIRTFEITLNDEDKGIVGSALIVILESHEEPQKSIALNSKNVAIDGEIYTLKKSIFLMSNEIEEKSTSITINDDDGIEENTSHSIYSRSKSYISFHGIEIPATLFPNSWEIKRNQVKLSWPFPLILIADICGNRDLDLNSARTEIIMSEKWIDFEEDLAFLICNEIPKSVTIDYWNNLKTIFETNTKSEVFLRGLNRVEYGKS